MRFPWWLVAVGAAIMAMGGGYLIVTKRQVGNRWTRLLPETRSKAQQLIDKANAAGLRVMFWDGWRAPEESAKNIAAGTSQLSDPYNSYHVWGLAFDLVFVNDAGLPTWLEDRSKPAGWVDPRWRQLAALGESLGLYSGGLHWGWDWPHFQMPGTSVASLRASYGTNYQAFLSQRGVAVA